ncbi:hypothetical protein SBD_1072 [Streptomyces bottropensis ATCC 25435]|uniref:Uncharacterized protein n=1 Tax=Streptomyces bottropensis ATCC 25435 TaxID=1054862 RepID=M3G1C3_9ACTN|nr:hypothetical protein SBD_1072 [Streptomyces bottropensis ATCC 25435]
MPHILRQTAEHGRERGAAAVHRAWLLTSRGRLAVIGGGRLGAGARGASRAAATGLGGLGAHGAGML